MKVDFDTPILDIKGKQIKDGQEEMRLSTVVSGAMLAPHQSDQSLGTKDKVRMFRLAQLAVAGGEQELTTEDVAFIQERVGKMYAPLIVGRTYDILEGPKETSKPRKVA